MSIKIVIERRFKEPVTPEILDTLDEIRIQALRDRGYIGGETVVNASDNREVIVFSSWTSVDDWKTWYEKKDWKELEKGLAPLHDGDVKVRIFEPGADYAKKVSGK